jgi:hypothetical protein
MLVAVDSISAEKWPDVPLLVIAGGDGDCVVELLRQFLPLTDGGSTVDLSVLIFLLGDVDHVAVAVGHTVSSHQQRSQMQLDGCVLIGFVFVGKCSEIDLKALTNFLV